MRAFLAVEADPEWVESAQRFVGRVKAATPAASWTRSESWHLTLKFFGDVAPDDARRFAAAVAPAVEKLPAASLQPGDAAVFPPRGRARVLAVGFAASPAREGLVSLARVAERAGRSIGVEPEERPYHPHVTFARIRSPWPPAAVDRFREEARAWPFPPWRLRSCVLYESRLDSAGAVHTPLVSFDFARERERARA